MATLTPVDYDPFAAPAQRGGMVPVDYDPFDTELPAKRKAFRDEFNRRNQNKEVPVAFEYPPELGPSGHTPGLDEDQAPALGLRGAIERVSSNVGDAISQIPGGFARRGSQAAAAATGLVGLPLASILDALQGGSENVDAMAGGVVQPLLDNARRGAPDANAGFGTQAGEALGALAFDMPVMAMSSGTSGVAPVAAPSMWRGLGNVVKDNVGMSIAPGVTSGAQTAIDVLNAGGDAAQAFRAGGAEAAASAITNVLPLNAAGGIISRAVQGAGSNVVADAAAVEMVNPFLPDSLQRDAYDPTQMGISAIVGAPMGVAFGDRPRGPDAASPPAVGDRQPNVDGAAPTADDPQVEDVTLDQFRVAIAEYAAQLEAKRDGTPDQTVNEGGTPFVVKGTPPAELTADEIEQLQRIEQFKDDPAGVAASFGFRIVDLPAPGAEAEPAASDATGDVTPDVAPAEPPGPLASAMLALPPPEPIQVDPAGVATTPAQRDQRQQLGITPDIARIIASQKARENAHGAAPAPVTDGAQTNEGQVTAGQDSAKQDATSQGQSEAGTEQPAGPLTTTAPQETAAPAPEAVAEPAMTPEQETARQDLDLFKSATRSRGVVSIPVPQGSNAEAVRKALKRAGVRGVMAASKGVVKLQHNQVDVFDAWIKTQESTNAGPTADQPAAAVAAAGPSGGTGGARDRGDGTGAGDSGAVAVEPVRRTFSDKVFKPEVHDVLDWIALNGGLDRDALAAEGIDPANWGGRRNGNQRFFGRPLFRKGGGMKADGLREALQGAGFLPEDPPDAPPRTGEALDLLDKAMRGGRVMLSEGQDADYAAAEARRFEEEQERVERWLGTQPDDMRSLYEANPDAVFELMARDGTSVPPDERVELDRVAPEDEAGARTLEEWARELRDSGVDETIAGELVLELSFAKSSAEKVKAVEAVAKTIKEVGNVDARTGAGHRAEGVRAEAEASAEPGSAEPASTEPIAGSDAPAREAAEEPRVEPTPAPPADLFGAKPVKEQALADAKAKVDAKLTGGNVGMLQQGDGELFAGPRPEQADLAKPQASEPAAQPAPAAKPESTAEPKSAPKPKGIDDFGEILTGARKHYAQAYADKVKDALGLDVAKHPLSQTWPEPDYDKLLEGGADPFVTAWVHAARDEIPAKPSSPWKLKGWVESVTMLRDVSNKLLTGEIAKDKLTERLDSGRWRAVQSVTHRAELYEAVGHAKSLKGITLSEHHYSLYRGENNVHLWAVEKQAKATAFGNWPHEIATGKTKAEALAAFKAKMAQAEAAPEKEAKGTTFEIYGSRHSNSVFFIGKKVNRRILHIKDGFTTVKDARAYLGSNAPRVGIDHRAGGDVTPEQFADAFGFRGVQFGNYVEAGRRQRDLNEAYDALHDLAGVLGVPTRALSLNGELGLAFGARGKGGKKAPSAHYEPGTVVINLTKGSGAGSLAHEWWHAIDNYFARMAGDKGGFMSRTAYTDPRVRLAMRESFMKLRRAIASTRLQERSRRLDDLRSKDYWTTEHEMSARAFESYVIAKLEDQSAANDYLANIVSEDGFGIEDGYPYPTAGELPTIRAAFDDFFSTVETRDNGGVIAFLSRSSVVAGDGSAKGMSVLEAQAVADDFLASYNGNIPLQVRVAAKQEDLYGPKATPERVGVIKGAYHAKSRLLTLAAVHLQDRADAARTLRHETLGHFGLNTLTPTDKLDLLQKVVASKGEKGLAEIWAKVDEHYSDKSEIERAEEVFAFAAEQDRGTLGRAWDSILSLLAKALRAVGLTKSMVTLPELHQLAHRISEGIRTGKAKQQTFPDRDDAQFSREEAAELANLGASLRDATGSDLARRAAAQFVGKPLANRETGIKATVSMSTLGKMLSNSAVKNSVSGSAHAMAVANLDKLFPLAIRRLTRADNEGSVAVGAIHHFDVPMPFDGDVLRVKMLVKELRQGGQGNRLYTVAAVEIEKPASERGDSTVLTDQARLPAPPAGFDDRFAQMVRAVKGEPDASLSLDDGKFRKDGPPVDEQGVVRELPDPQPEPPSNRSQKVRATASAKRVKAMLELQAMGLGRRAAGWDHDAGRWQGLSGSARKARERLQDSLIALRDVQDNIEGSIGGALEDGMNVYRMENLMRDRVGDRQRMLEKERIEPLIAHLKRNRLTLDQLHDYLLARAAPERNAKIAKINEDMPDAGSGLRTADAEAIMRGELAGPYSGKVLGDRDLRVLAEAADMVDGLRKFTLDALQRSGMLSAAQRAALEADKFYVPMRGRADPANDVGGRRPATILRRSNEPNIERALGRGEGNLPKNILPEMISDAQQAIFDAELVHVKRALLKQALAYPNPAVWDVEPVRTEYRFDKATGEAVLTVTTAAVDADSTLVIPMPNGKAYRLRFADPDLQRALMTMGEQDMKAFVRFFGAINRWQSAVFTRYNPAFVPVNLVRDVGFGLTSVAANHGTKVLGETVAGYAPAVRALWVDARDAAGSVDKPLAEMTMVDFAREFAASGGKMNAVAYADMDTVAKDFAARVRTLNDLWADGARGLMMREAGRRTAEKAFGLIERSNDAIENALRLALYASLRKNGKSIDQAAEAAKNVTVNFRRKGSLGAVMNAIYLFFNAGMQGAHATLKLLRNKKVIAGLTTMGAMQGLFAWLLMNEDDDGDGVSAWDAIPAYRRERSFIIPTGLLFGGDPKHVTMIPLQYGFNLFPYLGGRIAQRAHDEINGTLRPKDSLIGDMAKATINSFIPVPIYEGPEALLGNLAQIVFQLKANKDDLGRPITSENPYAAGDPPRSTMGRDTTSAIFKGVATALNRLGGGDDYTPPWILPQLTDVSPEELDFIWSQVAGGVGSTFSRGMSAAEGLATGRFDSAGEVMAATPIINAFGGTFREERAVADRYYAIGDEVERAERKRDGLREIGDDAGMDAVGETAYGQARFQWKNTQKIVKRLSKQIREARIDPNLTATEREAEIKRLTRERADAQRQFLQSTQELERERDAA